MHYKVNSGHDMDYKKWGGSCPLSESKKMSLRNFRVNTLRPKPNGRSFTDDSFKWIFLNKIVWISLKISLKFVPKGPINNIPALVWIMAWRRSGNKPLSEPMLVSLPTHICVTSPQWVKGFNMKCKYIYCGMVELWDAGITWTTIIFHIDSHLDIWIIYCSIQSDDDQIRIN